MSHREPVYVRVFRLLVLGVTLSLGMLGTAYAQPGKSAQAPEEATTEAPGDEPADAAESGATGKPSGEAELVTRQTTVADRYARLEKLMFDLSALEAAENPRRAALLRQAVQQSSDDLTRKQLETIAQMLGKRDFRRAAEEQEAVLQNLNKLLELLLSENRPDRLKSEQERIREYIKELERIIRLQGSVQGRTEGGVDPQKLAEEQAKVAERTGKLAKEIQENEEPAGASNEQRSTEDETEGDELDTPRGEEKEDGSQRGKSAEGKDGEPSEVEESSEGEQGGEKPDNESQSESEGESGEEKESSDESEGETPKPTDGEPMNGDPSQGEPQEGDPQDGQPQDGQPQEGQPQQGQPQDGQPQEGQPSESGEPGEPPPQNENPARKRIQAAEQRMREAQKRLEEAKREESLEEQEKAREELAKAKAELEEILRQMREEEVGRMLSLLEGRFRKMLEMQLKVYESTKRLDRIPEADRGRDFAILANNLSGDERKIALEADKALLLLQEEGSSIAFPETVEQIRDEMNLVSDRLAEVKVGILTQQSQEEIIAALEEMIAALQKAQQDQEQRQQQQQQQQQMQPGDPALVDRLAELKMIRSLQMRVNTRTQRLARLLADEDDPVGQATDEEIIEALEVLAEREHRILQITRDLILEKNK